MKIAYCVVPESGGLFSFYLNLKRALAPHGWELVAPCVGVSSWKRWDSAFADESCHLIAQNELDPQKSAMALVDWIEDNEIDIFMPMDSSVAASALPHMKSGVRLVTRCSTLSDFGFRICLLCPERLHRIVVMTPAQKERMLRYQGARGKVHLIPHGVDLDAIVGVQGAKTDVLRLLYLGRLEDRSKGVLFIPDIIVRLGKAGVSCEMDIIGDGVDRSRLELRVASLRLENRVKLLGTLSEGQVRNQLNTVHYDLLVMPSRYEGFPNAILEAMAAGIVPVVSRLEGISDFIIEDGVNGMLCGIGNTGEFASAIRCLDGDHCLQKNMAAQAKKTVSERFSLRRMGEDYDRMFNEVMNEANNYIPVSWDKFVLNSNYTPSFRNYVPDWVKNIIRHYVRI